MTDAREIILRRRARFLASALGGLTTIALGPRSAQADEIAPAARFAPSVTGRCVAEKNAPPDAVRESRAALARAREKHRRAKDLEGAIAEIRGAPAYLPDLAELEAQLHVEAGRPWAARAALEARANCTGLEAPLPDALAKELASLRERTALLTIGAYGQRVVFDGMPVDGTVVGGVVEIYVEPGEHLIKVGRDYEGAPSSIVIVTAGETKSIDPGPIEPPHPCLSPPWHPPREDAGPLGISLLPTLFVDVAAGGAPRPGVNPNLFGLTIAPFFRAGGRSLEIRIGSVAAPAASSKGFAMPLGGWASGRYHTGSAVSIGGGAASGYFFAPAPTHATVGAFEAVSSFFVEPNVSFAARLDPFEIEARTSILLTGQDDAIGSRFGASYVTLGVGVTWIPRRERRDVEMAWATQSPCLRMSR